MKKIILTFFLLLLSFLFIIGEMFIPFIGENLGGFFFLAPMLLFCLLGVVLLLLTLRQKIEGKLKIAFLLTSSSAVGFFIFVILHNLFYALSQIVKEILVLNYLAEALHAIFFLIAVIVCPVGFIAGSTTIIIFLLRNKIN